MRTFPRRIVFFALSTACVLGYNIQTADAGCEADIEVVSETITITPELDCLKVEAQGYGCVGYLGVIFTNDCDEQVILQQTTPTPQNCDDPERAGNACNPITLVAGESFEKSYYPEHKKPYAIAFDVTSQEEQYKLDIELVATVDTEVYQSGCSITSLHNTTPSFAALAALTLAGALISRRRRQ